MKPVFVDLDSTLANTQHRHHLINSEDWGATDWDAYSRACANDEVVEGVAALVRMLFDEYTIVILSGRSDSSRTETRKWLRRARVPYDVLILRSSMDSRSNEQFKIEKMEQWLRWSKNDAPALVIDDWPPLVAEVEKRGWPLLLVNPNYPVPERVSRAVDTVWENIENNHGYGCAALEDEVLTYRQRCDCEQKEISAAFDRVSGYLRRFEGAP